MRHERTARDVLIELAERYEYEKTYRGVRYDVSDIGAAIRRLSPEDRELLRGLTSTDMANLRPLPGQFYNTPKSICIKGT
jgi:hypothetical protein